MARFVGEYRPPQQLVAMSAARVTGAGHLGVDSEGLQVDARMLAAPVVPRFLLSVIFLVGAVASGLIPGFQQIGMVITIGVVAVAGWFYWRAEFGTRVSARVPWSAIEHVTRLASDEEIVAIVLADGLSGPGSPEQVYFAATLGIDEVVAALAEHAPEALSMELAPVHEQLSFGG